MTLVKLQITNHVASRGIRKVHGVGMYELFVVANKVRTIICAQCISSTNIVKRRVQLKITVCPELAKALPLQR